jgi:hypothetical protein
VDVESRPERKYIYGAYALSRAAFVSILASILLCLFIVWRAHQSKSRPGFIYWDELDTRFKIMPSAPDARDVAGSRFLRLHPEIYLEEYFVREYIRNAFEISLRLAENENRWCECADSGAGNLFAMPEKSCFVCRFSDARVYDNFRLVKKEFERMAESGTSRSVSILKLELIDIQYPPVGLPLAKRLLGFKEPTQYRHTEYRVDFLLEDRLYGEVSREVMTAYIRVVAPAGGLVHYKVLGASYMFHPKADMAIARHIRETSAGAK